MNRLTDKQERKLRAELTAADIFLDNVEEADIPLEELAYLAGMHNADQMNLVYTGYKLGLIRGRGYEIEYSRKEIGRTEI